MFTILGVFVASPSGKIHFRKTHPNKNVTILFFQCPNSKVLLNYVRQSYPRIQPQNNNVQSKLQLYPALFGYAKLNSNMFQFFVWGVGANLGPGRLPLDSGGGDVELADVFVSVASLAVNPVSECNFWKPSRRKNKVCPSDGGLKSYCRLYNKNDRDSPKNNQIVLGAFCENVFAPEGVQRNSQGFRV